MAEEYIDYNNDKVFVALFINVILLINNFYSVFSIIYKNEHDEESILNWKSFYII
jgi:hypothetical protein